MSKTTTSAKFKYCTYLTKHMRKDLHDRLRVQAALRRLTIEDIVNITLDAGLPAVEEQTSTARAVRRAAARAMETADEA